MSWTETHLRVYMSFPTHLDERTCSLVEFKCTSMSLGWDWIRRWSLRVYVLQSQPLTRYSQCSIRKRHGRTRLLALPNRSDFTHPLLLLQNTSIFLLILWRFQTRMKEEQAQQCRQHRPNLQKVLRSVRDVIHSFKRHRLITNVN